ncbi:NUDIX domain-containing protein [Actinomadura livida]|uniref:ADP-ribose pyrophosphatase YjhB (NUDIX family) n=1 Tax=Actinomadura livida TaxID=79909 RepID=A0A7W7I8W2_9ACTN|nr:MULTISPECIES: NUDIX hydrolase [Actinomadura]MBB4772353.1 ADP-ribose pyrophosphatase YjhB (NUDIX family) [Actinomadura catellatispora]GGU23569.1 NUDIX hydrolase [Actinomadura livida]
MPEDPAASFAHARAAAGVLFFDDQDRIMLVEPTYKNYLDVPGGYVERGETPHQAATREVAEELNIRPNIGRLLVTDWAPTETEGDKILFLFDGGTLTPAQLKAIRLAPTELRAYAFYDLAQIHTHTIPRLARRLTHAHTAHHNGTCHYLEHGNPII